MNFSVIRRAPEKILYKMLDIYIGWRYNPITIYRLTIYQPMNEVRRRVHLAAGTLYGALNALCSKGWIIQLPAEDESRRKEYKLTEKGMQVLRGEVARLRELADNGEKVLAEE